MARREKSNPNEKQEKPQGNRSHKTGSAFNEKPAPQPVHSRPDAEPDPDSLENTGLPPGVSERNDQQNESIL